MILFIKPHTSSFINTDQKILETHFEVTTYQVARGKSVFSFALGMVRLFFFLLMNGSRFDVFVTWFGDYHSAVMVFVSKLLGKKTVIIAGGQEAVNYRDLGKGVYQNRLRGTLVRYALRNATLILPNHTSLIFHENYFYNPEHPHIDGIRHYVKNIKARIEVLPNGIDTSRIERDLSIPKENNLILTVANVYDWRDFINKGFDLMIETARMCPDLNFVIVRMSRGIFERAEELYRVSELKNLEIITEFCPDDKLKSYFNRAKLYAQISITEGMPVSLGEAMLCECIPIGSNVNGIPDAMGGTGVIVYRRTAADLEKAIREAQKKETGAEARKYTIDHFSIELREAKLVNFLKSV